MTTIWAIIRLVARIAIAYASGPADESGAGDRLLLGWKMLKLRETGASLWSFEHLVRAGEGVTAGIMHGRAVVVVILTKARVFFLRGCGVSRYPSDARERYDGARNARRVCSSPT